MNRRTTTHRHRESRAPRLTLLALSPYFADDAAVTVSELLAARS